MLYFFIFVFLLSLFIFIPKNSLKGYVGEYFLHFSLKLLLRKSYIIHDINLYFKNGSKTQIDHIILCETGIYVIETKNMQGSIYGDFDDKNWVQVFSNGNHRSFLNPIKQNKIHVDAVFYAVDNKIEPINLVYFFSPNKNNIQHKKLVYTSVFAIASFIKKQKKKLHADDVKKLYLSILN